MLACAQPAEFELRGHVRPEQSIRVYLQAATSPFHASATADLNGRFHFRRLTAGEYVMVLGSIRRSIEIGPSLADPNGRVNVNVDLTAPEVEPDESGHRVSVRQLSIPKQAWREYEDAEKALARRDVSGAVAHFKRALAIAPRFATAWNDLGTIAYQTAHYVEAEADFRKALDADPEAYAPLVNLGGVLINLGRLDEALEFNQRAVLNRPKDPLANAQLGMAYFYSGRLDSAEKYLSAAKQIDPDHFSHPQAMLADIHLRRNEPEAAMADLQDLLERHPDLPNASAIRAELTKLRQLIDSRVTGLRAP